jgi:hypothetical protein
MSGEAPVRLRAVTRCRAGIIKGPNADDDDGITGLARPPSKKCVRKKSYNWCRSQQPGQSVRGGNEL